MGPANWGARRLHKQEKNPKSPELIKSLRVERLEKCTPFHPTPPYPSVVVNHRSSSSRSIASGFAAVSSAGLILPASPVLAATKPAGARACRSRAAIASSPASDASSSVWAPLPLPFCWPRATAWEAMKLTSVLWFVSFTSP